MPRKAKASTFIDEIFISKKNYEKILMWSQSEREINFICFGNDKIIENVSRLSNLSRYPKSFSLEGETERKVLVKEKKKNGYTVIANGHSHPSKYHDPHPSDTDIRFIERGSLELIVFPYKGSIRAWFIRPTKQSTLNSEVKISLT
jgi:proteasome lid subunit RPN8/RPN11